ncbi:hypothetical protein ACO8D0_05285 [Streptomyces pratensis]
MEVAEEAGRPDIPHLTWVAIALITFVLGHMLADTAEGGGHDQVVLSILLAVGVVVRERLGRDRERDAVIASLASGLCCGGARKCRPVAASCVTSPRSSTAPTMVALACGFEVAHRYRQPRS